MARHRIVYITAHALEEYRSDFSFDAPLLYTADDAGKEQFFATLMQEKNIVTSILLDIVEEEFHNETFPLVRGRDRKLLIARQMDRVFRALAFRCAISQGRVIGTKTENALLLGVTNPEMLIPWLDVMHRAQTPVRGVYSVPLLSTHIARALPSKNPHILLISQQLGSGWRQTYTHGNHIKLSRLINSLPTGKVLMDDLLEEIRKTHRYIQSLKLLGREDKLEVWIAGDESTFGDISKHSITFGDPFKVSTISIKNLAQRLKLPGAWPTTYGNALFAALLFKIRPRENYARSQDVEHYKNFRTQQSIHFTTAIVGAAALFTAGIGIINGKFLEGESQDILIKTQQAEAALGEVKSKQLNLPLNGVGLKAGIETLDKLRQYRTHPTELLTVLGRIMTDYPEFKIDRLGWLSSDKSDAKLEDEQLSAPVEGDVPQTMEALYNILWMYGHIEDFDGNYRQAHERIHHLVSRLRQMQSPLEVEILRLPLEINPNLITSGGAGERFDPRQEPAYFELRISTKIAGVPTNG